MILREYGIAAVLVIKNINIQEVSTITEDMNVIKLLSSDAIIVISNSSKKAILDLILPAFIQIKFNLSDM